MSPTHKNARLKTCRLKKKSEEKKNGAKSIGPSGSGF